MRNKRSETLVGIFVVLGIALLILMTLKIEKFQIGKDRGYLGHIYFDTASGLDRNSAVKVSGVHVGNVERISLEKGMAKVTVRVPSDVVLYQDAKAYLKSEGFLGERYVEISPGTAGSPKLEPNGIIAQGEPPVDMEQVLSKMGAIREDIRDVTKPLGDVLKAVDVKKVEGVIDNLNRFSGQLTGIATESKETIEKIRKGEGTLGKLIADEAIYQEAKKTVEVAKEAAESVKKTVDSLKNVSEKIERGEGTLGKVVNDDSLYQEARKAVETLKNVSEKIERGEGTLGKLIHDESLYQGVKETVESAKGTMQSANEAFQSVKQIAEKIEKGEGTLGKLVQDDTLMKEAEKTLKKVQKTAEGVQEQTPITVLGTIIGIFF
ncbi:MAG: MCE family protein [Syntrophaceae bacterium]|nr:MCE family protein [Syntrophaceae bacterium]